VKNNQSKRLLIITFNQKQNVITQKNISADEFKFF
tara:strand:- start:10750 stop:10854 length:105 start_codon:yes stop_codon:yes gene_type:complete